MPLTFSQTYDKYRDLSSKNMLPQGMGLAAFSRFANDMTGSNEFDQGDNSWVGEKLRQGNYWLNRGIESTGLPDLTGQLGASAFESLGANPEIGRQVGHALPRGVVDFASMFIPGLGQANALRVAGGMMAFNTFGETGSLPRAAVSYALPGLMSKAGQAVASVLPRLGLNSPTIQRGIELFADETPTGREILQPVITSTKDKLLNYLATNLGATGTAEAVNYGTEAIANQTLNPYAGQSIWDRTLAATLGNVPFAIGDIPRITRTPTIPIGPQTIVPRPAQSPTADIPNVSAPRPVATSTGLEAIRAQQLAQAARIEDSTARSKAIVKANYEYAIQRYQQELLLGKTPEQIVGPLLENAGNTLWTNSALFSPLVQAHQASAPSQQVQKPVTFREITAGRRLQPDSTPALESQPIEFDLPGDPTPPPVEVAAVLATTPEVTPESIRTVEDVVRTSNDGKVLEEIVDIPKISLEEQATIAENLVKQGTPIEEAAKLTVAGTANTRLAEAKLRAAELLAARQSREAAVLAPEPVAEVSVSAGNEPPVASETPVKAPKKTKGVAAAELFEAKRAKPESVDVDVDRVVNQFLTKGNAPREKIFSAWENWRNKVIKDGMRAATPKELQELKQRLAKTVNEVPELVSSRWEKDLDDEGFAFATRGEAVEVATRLNNSMDPDANFEYRAYSDRSKNGPAGVQSKDTPFGVKRYYKNEESRNFYEADRTKLKASPEAEAEVQNVKRVLDAKSEDPDVSNAQLVTKRYVEEFFRDNAKLMKRLNMTRKQIEAVKVQLESGQVKRWEMEEMLKKLYDARTGESSLLNDLDEGSDAPEPGVAGASKMKSARAVEDVEPKPLVPGFDETMVKLMKMSGFTNDEAQTWLPAMQKMHRVFGVDDVQLGMLINNAGTEYWGFGSMGPDKYYWLAPITETMKLGDKATQFGMTIAHEMGHVVDGMVMRGVAPKYVTDAINTYKMWLEESPQQASDFLKLWKDTLPEPYRDLPEWDHFLSNQDPKELYANSMALWATSKSGKENAEILGVLTPPPAKGFIKTLTNYARRVIGNLRSAIFVHEGQQTKAFKDTVESVTKMFDDLTASFREADAKYRKLDKMLALGTSDAWKVLATDMEARSGITPSAPATKSTAERNPNFAERAWDGWIRTTQGLIEGNPAFARAGSVLVGHGPTMQRFLNQSTAPVVGGINPDTGTIMMRGPQYKAYQRLRQGSPKNIKLASEIAQWMQRHETNAFSEQALLSENPTWPPKPGNPKLGDQYRALDPKVQDDIKAWIQGEQESHRIIGEQTVESFKESGRNAMMLYLGNKGNPQKWAQAPDTVKALTNAMEMSLSADPTTKMVGDQQLTNIKASIGNDQVFTNLLDMWAKTSVDANELQATFDGSPGHMSLIRTGEWHVRAFDPQGREIADALPNMEAYEAWKQQMKDMGYGKFSKPEKVKRGRGVTIDDKVMNLVSEVEQRAIQRLENLGLAPQLMVQMREALQMTGDIGRLMNAADLTTPGNFKGLTGAERKKTPGNMNMIETQQIYRGLSARMNANRIMKSRLTYELTNPNLERFQSDVDLFKQQIDNYMQPDSALARHMTKFNAVYFLGGNVPAMMTNFMQSWMTTLPEMVSRGVGTVKSLKMLNSAAKDMVVFTGRVLKANLGFDKDHMAIQKMKDPAERRLFKWLNDSGEISFGTLGELHDQTADASIDLNTISNQLKPMTYVDKAKSMVGNFANSALKLYSGTEHFNKRLAALVGYRIAREKMASGYNEAQAFEYARDFMRASTYSGGRANRPAIPFEGKYRLMGHMAYSLQSYTLGWLNQAARYIGHWKGTEYLDLSPEQRSNARKAALTMFGTQMAAAGALGMPFVGAALKLVQNLTGNDIQGDLWRGLDKVFDEDTREGSGLARIVMTGAANAMAENAGVPADLGSRWSINGVLGLNPYDGFAGDFVFGPTGGLVSSALSGLKSVAEGEIGEAAKVLAPPAMRKAVSLYLNDGRVQTPGGEAIDATPADQWAYAVGFTPQKLSRLQQYSRIASAEKLEESMRDRKDAAEVLNALGQDPMLAQQKLADIVRKSEGAESAKDVAMRVAKAAAQRLFPADVRTKMPRQGGEHLAELARAMGVSIGEAQEVQRQQYINSVMAQLGQPPQRLSPELFSRDSLGDAYSPFQSRR